MRDMFESEETFIAYATIDAGHYMIKQHLDAMHIPEIPINRMIDEVTGYATKQKVNTIQSILLIIEDIIEAERVIDKDTKSSEAYRNKLIAMLDELK
jgi:hypothetical protein